MISVLSIITTNREDFLEVTTPDSIANSEEFYALCKEITDTSRDVLCGDLIRRLLTKLQKLLLLSLLM